MAVHFSLILATLDRVSEVARFLDSLSQQSHRDFSLILVDQNADGRLDGLVSQYEKIFDFTRIRNCPGLSRSRNAALAFVTGDIIAFPDDDCVYPAWLLEEVSRFLTANRQYEGITGRTAQIGTKIAFREVPVKLLTPFNVWQCAISYTIFLRHEAIQLIGLFDETLGVGAGTPWGAGEETDYLLRAITLKQRLAYHPGVIVNHPEKSALPEIAVSRAFSYSCGVGRVLSKNSHFRTASFYSVLRTCVGLLVSTFSGDALQYKIAAAKLHGKLKGMRSKPPRKS